MYTPLNIKKNTELFLTHPPVPGVTGSMYKT